MLIQVIKVVQDLGKCGCTDIKISLSCRGFSFGRLTFGVVFCVNFEHSREFLEDISLQNRLRLYQANTIHTPFSYKEWLGYVSALDEVFEGMGVDCEIVKPDNDVQFHEAIDEKNIEDQSYKKGVEDGKKSYFYHFGDLSHRITLVEQKIKNPEFVRKIREMNPDGILLRNAKGKEAVRAISEINVIQRHIKRLTSGEH